MSELIRPYIDAAKEAVAIQVHACAAELGLPASDVMPHFEVAMRHWFKGGFKADGRANTWRARIRLYQDEYPNEPTADSDPDLGPDKPGASTFKGLPAVAECVAELAHEFHRGPCAGLNVETLKEKLKGLRPTISRRRGNAVWRLGYKAPDGYTWTARVDIERIDE